VEAGAGVGDAWAAPDRAPDRAAVACAPTVGTRSAISQGNLATT
jgi:hypothetical protein